MAEQTAATAKLKTHDLTLIALFAALTAICAWITVPLPGLPPFTMQVFAVFVSLCCLGGRRGTLAVLLYILLGAVGLPVFSGFQGGVGVLLGMTGGYIVGFLFTALIYWAVTAVAKRVNFGVTVLALTLGLVACYAFGSVWFMVIYMQKSGAIGLGSVLMMCVVPYLIPDFLKMALALTVSAAVKKAMRRA